MSESPERWGVVLTDTRGQVLRNPAGDLFLEIQVGESWWSLPVPPAISGELIEAIETEGARV